MVGVDVSVTTRVVVTVLVSEDGVVVASVLAGSRIAV